MKEDREILKQAADELGVPLEAVPRTVKKMLEETRELEKKIREANQ